MQHLYQDNKRWFIILSARCGKWETIPHNQAVYKNYIARKECQQVTMQIQPQWPKSQQIYDSKKWPHPHYVHVTYGLVSPVRTNGRAGYIVKLFMKRRDTGTPWGGGNQASRGRWMWAYTLLQWTHTPPFLPAFLRPSQWKSIFFFWLYLIFFIFFIFYKKYGKLKKKNLIIQIISLGYIKRGRYKIKLKQIFVLVMKGRPCIFH